MNHDEARRLLERIEVLEAELERRTAVRRRLAVLRSRVLSSPWLAGALAAVTVAIPLAAWASTLNMPYTFSNGTPADANEVNANFNAIETAVNDNHSRISTLESAPPAGDITQVIAGVGLSGGGTFGNVSLSVDSSQVQTRVSTSCPPGSSIRAISQGGAVTCETDDVGGGGISEVVAGTGLTGGGASSSVSLALATGGVTSAHIQNGAITSADISTSTAPTFGGLTVNGPSTLAGNVRHPGTSDVSYENVSTTLRFLDAGGANERMRLYSGSGWAYMYDYDNGQYVFRSDGNGLGIGTAPSVGADVTISSLQVTGATTIGYQRVSATYQLNSSGTCASVGGGTCNWGQGWAVCPAGKKVIGGGAAGASPRFGAVGYSYPQGDDTWACSTSDTGPTTHTCWAICARVQ